MQNIRRKKTQTRNMQRSTKQKPTAKIHKHRKIHVEED